MKRLIVGLLMYFLMATGLVAVSHSAAVAADCPYEGRVDTKTTGAAKAQNGPNKALIKVKVKTVGSNATPKGKVRVAVKLKSKSKIEYDVTKAYTGGQLAFTTSKLKPGKYVCALVFFQGESRASTHR